MTVASKVAADPKFPQAYIIVYLAMVVTYDLKILITVAVGAYFIKLIGLHSRGWLHWPHCQILDWGGCDRIWKTL
jgi:hypothetical protein